MTTEPDPDRLVHLDVADRVATITLDSPANRNALSLRLVADLHAALDGADAAIANRSVRSIVLAHTPPAFCSGADLKARSAGGSVDSRPMVRAFERLMDAEVPTIAAVTGPVRAGGIGLMAACDLVVVHPDVRFALTEVRIGVAAAIISVPIFRRASASHLASALLTGEPFSAATAREAGLVTHVADDVTAVVATLTAAVAMGGPIAVAATKRLLRGAFDRDAERRASDFDAVRRLSEALFVSDEAREGMSAFAEKRRPAWQVP